MKILEQALEVNKLARKNRHLRVFRRSGLFVLQMKYLFSAIARPLSNLRRTPAETKIGQFFIALKGHLLEALPISPQRRLFFQAGMVSVVALIITSVAPGATFTAASLDYSDEYMAAYALPGDIIVTDQDGYLVKANPQTDSSSRIGLNDYAVHTVASGETLSKIAGDYGISLETIMWENSLYNPNTLRIGQSLLIPPINGVSYGVQAGDSLEKIAKKYNVTVDTIIAQNNLENEILQKGQKLFLPGAKPIQPAAVARAGGAVRVDRSVITADPSTATPVLDIADSSKPPIWAAGGGTVEKVSSGTWGGGYGNHVIIDHGNGIKTLYAHMSSISVSEGQYVNQGDVLGIMGNTGRVYGRTGIHLHWEVIDNGVKKYPANYY
ncbi:M23 family metallopeptidase [Candidatus Peregrinibacteria bacterium]|nr:M23 family metallopeptidase [Candidatus Peregrinibacteria bacterium]